MLMSEAIETIREKRTAADPGEAAPEEVEEADTGTEGDEPDEPDEPEEGEDEPEAEQEDDEDGAAEEGAEAAADDDAPEDEEEIPPLPSGWSPTLADDWAAMTPTARDAILQREAAVEQRIASDAGRRTAEARQELERKVEQERTQFQERIKKLDPLIENLERAGASKYARLKDPAFVRDNPEEYVVLKAEYDADNETYQEAVKERQNAAREKAERDANAAKEKLDADVRALIERTPEYRGEKGSSKLNQDIARAKQYAQSLGYNETAINSMGVLDFEVLRDAMNYRTAKKAAASPAKKKSPAPAQPAVKPAARKPAADPAKKRLTEAQKSLKQAQASGSVNAQIKSAVQLMRAKRGG